VGPAAQSQYADASVTFTKRDLPWVAVRYEDAPESVDVYEKFDGQTIAVGSLPSNPTSQPISHGLVLAPQGIVGGTAYLIFDTHGSSFAVSGIEPVQAPATISNAWVPLSVSFGGAITQTRTPSELAVLRPGVSTIRIAVQAGQFHSWRLEYKDVAGATMTISSIQSSGRAHQDATIVTTGSNQTEELNVSEAQFYRSPTGGVEIQIAVKGAGVPIVSLERLVH
jgi:hypothetical protein